MPAYFVVGVVIALCILVWGISLLARRPLRKQKLDAHAIQNWVPLKTTTTDLPIPPDQDGEEALYTRNDARAQQNGHYSQSKYKL